MSRTVIGVMGGTVADETTTKNALELGRAIAENGWVLLSGGRQTGVMQASVTGAHEAGGLTVGVLFDDDPDLGYTRLVERTDGRLVVMYYWATAENPQQHIAASIWTP